MAVFLAASSVNAVTNTIRDMWPLVRTPLLERQPVHARHVDVEHLVPELLQHPTLPALRHSSCVSIAEAMRFRQQPAVI
jgi:hypothetical protein